MAKHSLRLATQWAIACAMYVTAAIAHGQVYKCTDAAGKTNYSDVPCAAGSKPLKLPGDGKGSATDPTTCAQLLDETHRLDAEAGRDAQRGRTESAQSAKRRQALARQYQARCVGITRSEAKPK